MSKKIKLLILIIMSMSVYFIYNNTKDKTINIISLGDSHAEGITSYGIKDYSYDDYLKLFLKDHKINTNLEKYSSKDMSIDKMLFIIKNTNKIKKDLRDSHILIINLGYNDLLYKLISREKLENSIYEINRDYNNLIKEIRKYYHNQIIVIGYSTNNIEDYYQVKGITMLNNVLKSNEEITYIDTVSLLKDDKRYFSNPNSNYPSNLAYMEISKKIIKKLEKIRNI